MLLVGAPAPAPTPRTATGLGISTSPNRQYAFQRGLDPLLALARSFEEAYNSQWNLLNCRQMFANVFDMICKVVSSIDDPVTDLAKALTEAKVDI